VRIAVDEEAMGALRPRLRHFQRQAGRITHAHRCLLYLRNHVGENRALLHVGRLASECQIWDGRGCHIGSALLGAP